MSAAVERFEAGTLGKVAAAVVVGLSVGTLLPPEPVTLPVLGAVPGVAVGAVGLVAGAGLYRLADGRSSGCGCGGECEC